MEVDFKKHSRKFKKRFQNFLKKTFFVFMDEDFKKHRRNFKTFRYTVDISKLLETP